MMWIYLFIKLDNSYNSDYLYLNGYLKYSWNFKRKGNAWIYVVVIP